MDGLAQIIKANEKAAKKYEKIKKGLAKAADYREAHQKRRS